MKNTRHRSKAQRQAWWASLTSAEQATYIEQRAAYKSTHMSPAGSDSPLDFSPP